MPVISYVYENCDLDEDDRRTIDAGEIKIWRVFSGHNFYDHIFDNTIFNELEVPEICKEESKSKG
jgi:hypothetical protein